MRIVVSVALLLSLLLGGCTVIEQELKNRGGYLDYVVDRHWMKADSKGMRALRAFAIQVSLARIASVSAKNDEDRQLLASRIGKLTPRFLPIYFCAYDTNPLGVPGAERDPCFYYDSAMVEYSTGLFDLAMVALPVEDAKKLINSVAGSAVNPINIIEVLDSLLAIGKDAIKYGRVVGALYRDTVELEVQLWLSTPAIEYRNSPNRVTYDDVLRLKEIYERRNDDLAAWLAEIEVLRGRGLEPVPHPKFFAELSVLMKRVCGLITKEPKPLAECENELPLKTTPEAVFRELVRSGKHIKLVGDVKATIPRHSPTPSSNEVGRIGKFEQQLEENPLKDLQRASCLTEDGKFTTETRKAILKFLNEKNLKDKAFPDRITAKDGAKLRGRLDPPGPQC